jgi:hypothetical protein
MVLCVFYFPLPNTNTKKPVCNCTTVATKLLFFTTNIRFKSTDPTFLARELDKYHGFKDYKDGGVNLDKIIKF